MARTIPVAGEPWLGDDPAVMKVLKITFGDSDQDVVMQVADSTGGLGVALCNLPYGIYVYDVGWRIIEAFNDSTVLTLGVDCGSDCDFFATSIYLGCSLIYPQMRTMRGSIGVDSVTHADTHLRQFGFTPDSDGNNLMIHVFTPGSTVADSGRMEVYVYYHAAVS